MLALSARAVKPARTGRNAKITSRLKAETTIISQVDQKNVTLSGVPQPNQPVVDTPESTYVSPAQRQAVRGFFRSAPAEGER